MRIPLLLCFVILFCSSYGQEDQRQIDSLNNIIDNQDSHDTARASAYVILSEILYLGRLDTMIPLCESAIKIIDEALLKSPDDSIVHYLNLTKSLALNNIGFVYGQTGQIALQLKFLNNSLELAERINEQAVIAQSLNNLGGLYYGQGDVETALKYYHKSMTILEILGDEYGLAYCLINLGYIHNHQGDEEKAVALYSRSIQIQEKIKDDYGLAYSLNNVASIWFRQNKFEKALEFFERCLKLKQIQGDKVGVGYAMNNIGYVYGKQDQLSKALEWHRRSLKIREGTGEQLGIASSYNNIAGIFLLQNKLDSASYYAGMSMEIGNAVGSVSQKIHSTLTLRDIALVKGNYQKALNYFRENLALNYIMKNKESQKATIKMESKHTFEVERRAMILVEAQEIKIKKNEKQRRINLQYSLIFITLLLSFGAVLSLGFFQVSPRLAEGLIFFSFLILFEFVLVLADPYVDNWTSGAPGYKLLFNAILAALIFPLHAWFEHVLKLKLIQNRRK